MSHLAQVLFSRAALKLDRSTRIPELCQMSLNDDCRTLPIPKSLTPSMAATQLQPITEPSGRTIGPLYVLTHGSRREFTTRSFIDAGRISRVIRPPAEVNDQV